MKSSMQKIVVETHITSFSLLGRGKVRDIYDLGQELLIVATDRISCFDVVLPTPIPEKGEILTQLSRFWFEKTASIIPNHLSRKRIKDVVRDPRELNELEGRSMIVKKAKPLPIEAIVRGYLSGSAWEEYRKSGTVCGQKFPTGLSESSALPEPIFTPSTKAKIGVHDENIPFEKMCEIIGDKIAKEVRFASLEIYREAASYAAKRGIIIADTKFEFGILNDKLILIDELLTPDSSRFWPADGYEPGRSQPSFDKQFVRDYLIGIKWDKKPPAPELPADIVEQTTKKYKEALERLTK